MIYVVAEGGRFASALNHQGMTMIGRDSKKNKPENYNGADVFETFNDARRRIEEDFPDRMDLAVFGVTADWEKDTYPHPSGAWWHCLINDATIVFP